MELTSENCLTDNEIIVVLNVARHAILELILGKFILLLFIILILGL
jgi:hypothetical protein